MLHAFKISTLTPCTRLFARKLIILIIFDIVAFKNICICKYVYYKQIYPIANYGSACTNNFSTATLIHTMRAHLIAH